MARRKNKKKSLWVKAKNILMGVGVAILVFCGTYTYFDSDTDIPSASPKDQTLSAQLTGKIVRVSDGDTVVLLDSTNTQHKIRLDGIDCPERAQDYGTKATDFTKNLCAGKYVKVDVAGIDKYKRVLGVLWVDGANVNEELLKNGLAWQYKYNNSAQYKIFENNARKKKLNIWSMSNPTAPWDFRKEEKTK